MSEAKVDVVEGEEKPKSGKGLIIALIAVVVVLIIAVGALAFMVMSSGHKDQGDEESGGHEPAAKVEAYKPEDRSKSFSPTYRQFAQPAPGAAPQYFDMEQFVTNFKGEGKAKHLAVKIKLMTYFPELSGVLAEIKPILVDRILSALRKKSYTELNNDDAQDKLAAELLTVIRATLDEQKVYPDTLDKVLIERFVMQ